jgi:hypothetical protein
MSHSLAGFYGAIIGWWASDRFFGGRFFDWMPAVPEFPKNSAGWALLFCTAFLLMGLDEVRRAISKRE